MHTCKLARALALLTLLVVVGCPVATPDAVTGPDVAAIATVVEAVYGEPAGKPTLFLGDGGAVDTGVMAQARSLIASKLQTKVLSLSDRVLDDAGLPFTPVDPDSGEPGVTIALGRFTLEQDGQLRVTASFVRQAGTERGCTEFLLSRRAAAWEIVEQRDANPNCPLSEEMLANYDAVVERVRAGDCLGLGARIGTCGRWLVVVESHIDSYKAWYFDPDTRLLAAEYLSDPMSDVETWTFGHADCGGEEFVQTEFVICGTPPDR